MFELLNSTYITYYLIAINSLTIILFMWDKLKSKIVNAQRIDESTFHTLGLLGGIFSTFILIAVINHKRTKFNFLIQTYLILALWIYIILKYYKLF